MSSLFVGPANFAGQGHQWARATERAGAVAKAESFTLDEANRFAFPVDCSVAAATYRFDQDWQRSQVDRLTRDFSHVLFEAFRPLFGDLFRLDPWAEAAELRRLGLKVAAMAHGSEVRVPSLHAGRHSFSPFGAMPADELVPLEAIARRNLALAASFPGPIFVSTPDLLDWLPEATWCPVVADQAVWRVAPTEFVRPVPVVAHVPSNAALKGTAEARAAASELDQAGLIEYRELRGVAPAAMPAAIQAADVVLDQFALGSYGVAAAEAMSAGRVVVGNVTPKVRAHVAAATGLDLPIVQAEPLDVGETLRRLVADREAGRQAAAAGQAFAAAAHDGVAAAEALTARFLGDES
ncbi:MAG: hypothetical protein LBO20_05015 [Bifidobacteriaceae bacterium]|jgi:hypothetical protein|nr:hypothetical protein [Bifidobacteriaceae bacterium]